MAGHQDTERLQAISDAFNHELPAEWKDEFIRILSEGDQKLIPVVAKLGYQRKGSHRNKFAILSVETHVWQGAKAQEYQDIPSFCNATRRDASALKM